MDRNLKPKFATTVAGAIYNNKISKFVGSRGPRGGVNRVLKLLRAKLNLVRVSNLSLESFLCFRRHTKDIGY